MPRTCVCGCHWFSCTRVQKWDLEISTHSDAEYDGGLADEYIEGPYICTQCGAEYQSLEETENE